MKRLLIPVLICLAACQQTKTASTGDSSEVHIPDSIKFTPPVIVQPETVSSDTIFIAGDFNGDGNADTAYSTLYKPAAGEDEQALYRIGFLSGNLPDMENEYGKTRLVNEGDLDGDGAGELSLFSEPLHGCVYSFTVWTFKNNAWKKFSEPMLIPTACEDITDEDLQKRVVLENDTLFVWKEDVNDENFRLQKHLLPVKQ